MQNNHLESTESNLLNLPGVQKVTSAPNNSTFILALVMFLFLRKLLYAIMSLERLFINYYSISAMKIIVMTVWSQELWYANLQQNLSYNVNLQDRGT